jgi:hypothetical protein
MVATLPKSKTKQVARKIFSQKIVVPYCCSKVKNTNINPCLINNANLTLFAVLSIFYFSVESSVIAYNWLHYGNKDEIQWYVNKSLGL